MINKDYSEVLKSALAHGRTRHPSAPLEHHAAFANAIAYLVTGASGGGYGGPSCREHSVSWAIAGQHGSRSQVETSIGTLTFQCPDGSLPRAGEWRYEKACQFAEPYCYGKLTKLHYECYRHEHCFDDALKDIEQIKKSLEASENL